jgi:ectoine hydroxylase-related dioxygenase (phytanoyl-CoA dioxygenase family)
MASIPVLSAKVSADELGEALDTDGCAVVRDVIDADVRRRITTEIGSHVERADPDAGLETNALFAATQGAMYRDFFQGNTRRVIGIVRKSPTFAILVKHPIMLLACDATLAPNCDTYQVHAAAALVVGPGAGTQVLHREEDAFRFFPLPRPNLVTASMWAMTDFTRANGATRVVPGSHRWPEDRVPREDEVASGEMTAGSVLFWTGGILHGAGPNSSNEWRFGTFLSFSLGWLRQEENQYLDVPPEDALRLPPDVRELVGYRMHTGLGYSEVSV